MINLMLNRLTIVVALVTAAMSIASAQDLVVKGKGDFPPPQLGIAPPRFEEIVTVSAGKRLDKSIVLYNYNSKPKSIKLTLVDVNRNQQAIKPSKSTLSPWTIINPKTFTIAPNGEQTVRFSVRPPLSFPQKTHYAMLKIEHHIDNAITVDEAKQAVTVTLGSSYGLPIIITTK